MPLSVLSIATLVTEEGAFGGPLRVAANQAQSLHALGHNITLIAGWDGRGDVPSTPGVTVELFRAHRLVPGAGFSGLVAPDLQRWLRRHAMRFDVAHVHLGRDLITMSAARRLARRKVPFVTQTHGMIATDSRLRARVMDAVVTRRLLARAAARLALTADEEAALSSVMRRPVTTVRIPNGVPAAEPRQRTPTDQPRVLFAARLHPRKRVTAFAEMAALLRDGGVPALFEVVGPDEGDLSTLRRAVASLRLEESLTYSGALPYDAVLDKLGTADVYVLPSVDEPFPMSVLEALSLGVPTVITNSCGIADTLRQHEAAIVTDGSPQQLAEAVELLLSDGGARTRLAARAHETARTVFSQEAVAAELVRVYEDAISARSRYQS